MGIRGYILRRTVYSIVLLFAVITLNFIIFEMMPGSAAQLFVNPTKPLKGQLERLEEIWGLRQPLHIRYSKYVTNMLTWQFGDSLISMAPVADEMIWRLPYTLLLLGGSTLLSLVIGVFLGVLVAHRRGSMFDTGWVVVSLITFSLPTFWMGMLFKYVFAYNLHLLPSLHAYPDQWNIIGNWPTPITVNILSLQIVLPSLTEISGRISHLIMPMTVLTLFQYGGWLLLARATMLETLTEDYIVTARAKGVKERTVLFKHALKNASLPLITNAALSFGFVLTGAIITESVFVWPGLGGWTWQAIQVKDIPVLQAIFYVIALCVIVANFISDILYGIVDPRIKYG